jgi:hypothetical protein
MALLTETASLDWSPLRDGVWVCRADGRLAGVIEARNDGFLASNRDSTQFLMCSTLDEAKAAFIA